MSARSVILNSNNWEEFNQNLVKLDNKEKGNAFELLTKYLFKVVPKYSNIYREVWIHNELPQKLKKKFNCSDDIGIDLFAEHSSGEYHAIQCKYHSDKTKNVTRSELDGFLAVLQSRPSLTLGYICSSANGYSKNIEKSVSKEIQYILSDDWQTSIDEYMWAIHKYIKDKAFKIKPFKPRNHQEKAIKEAKKHFKKESRGKLIFPCGAGKSLTGFWFTQELKSKNTLIAVPSLSLIKQTLDVYLREIVANKKKVKWLCICSDDGIGRDDDIVFKTENIGVPCQTDPEYIENWLKENKNENKIIFTTYQSGKIIAELSKKLDMSFDLGIFDEAHKTVGSSKKLFSHLLFEKNISIEKRMFMTATERFYGGQKSEDIISMDDVDIYGDTFSMMTFKEAIEAQPALLTDYKVITIDIKQSEISEFIKENRNVNFSGNWDKDIKSRSLASMLALRKAMKLFPIKNAVSFHSSIKQARLNEELQDYISDTYNYDPIDTFTVSGKIPTTKRNDIVQEFAKSDKALITNARCLTEGVDVPNIDCIVFADPRRSKVDIVQALGRALRTKEGKDWGYVILPVIYDDKTNEIDNDNFNEILSVVRGLAANDERIVNYFKFKENERIEKSKKGERIFNFEVFSEYIDESELKENLQIKLWDKLSRFEWMPFEEARDFARSLNLKSSKEWIEWRQNNPIIKIPIDVSSAYKASGYEGMSNFLGYEYLNYEECEKFARSIKLKNSREWHQFCKSGKKPNAVPSNPHRYYSKNEWINWPTFLGNSNEPKNKNFLNYEDAKNIIKKEKLKNRADWYRFVNSGKKPNNIPTHPSRFYQNKGWIDIYDFISTEKPKIIRYLNFEEARTYARSLKLKSLKEWRLLIKENKIPENIPNSPDNKYSGEGWIDWPDFLGNVTRVSYKRRANFYEAKEIVKKYNLKTNREWREFCKSGKRPYNIPSNPDKVYEEWNGWSDFLGNEEYLVLNIPTNPSKLYQNKGWKNWGNWLGSGNIATNKRKFLSFKQAREYTRKLNLQNQQEWKIFSNTKRPNYIPSSPDVVYKNKGWLSWGDWLGTKIGWDGNYIPFEEARHYIRNLNLKSQREWINYSKSVNIPINIPKKPEFIYKDKGWISLGDWLGTYRIAARFRSYREFNRARKFVHLLNLKSGTEWINYSKSGNKPEDIPSSPQVVYKNKGWISMGDWLGSGRIADNLKEYLDFNKARSVVRKMNFKSGNDYLNAWRKGLLPENIPAKPGKTYKNKGFVSMPDFLGYKSRWEWMPFEDAREFVKNMDLKSTKEYINAYKKGLIPKNIPFAPRSVYKNKGWISMGDWLGTGRVSDNLIKFIEFKEARKYVRCLGLSTHKQWREFIKSGKKPKNIPSGANKVYKSEGWKGWDDFLGKEKK